ncbi:MAG: hypothetical protein Q8O51_02755 [bacterium]|nr:hypothetical protein [bacterium]
MISKKFVYIIVTTFCVLVVLGIGLQRIRAAKVVPSTSTFGSAMQFTYSSKWVVESDPAGFPNVDPQKVQSILFRPSAEAYPDVTIRFWDNPNAATALTWAKNAAGEAELTRSPKEVSLGKNTFWMLSTADSPGLFETELFFQVGTRMMQVGIVPQLVYSAKPYFSPNIQKLLESINLKI